MPKDFSKVTRKEIEASPNMSDRERFTYIASCLQFNPVIQGISRKRHDEILHHFANEFCPTLTVGDMWRIMQEIDKNQKFLVEELEKITTSEEKTIIGHNFTKLIPNKGMIEDLVDKIASQYNNK